MTKPDDRYYYEPDSGHGLPHDPFNAIVAPRPIGWIGTRGTDGSVNLAPYSFFNAFCYRPPLIGFSSSGRKDTLRNAQQSGEFTWNLVTYPLAERMNATSASLDYGVDELAAAGLTALPGVRVRAMRVAESPVHFECKVTEIHHLKSRSGGPSEAWAVFGEVVAVHIARHLLIDGTFDTFGADSVMRAGGPSAYVRVRPESRFDMPRPA